MKLIYNVLLMIIFSFILQYYLMSYLMVNNINNITNSLGKIYISTIMALSMGIIEVGMDDFMMNRLTWIYYIVLFILLFISIIAYKKQIGITDIEYIKEMIEHHSMALLTSEEILNKTSNYHIKKLASNIKTTQSEEIQYMKLLKEKMQYNDLNYKLDN